MASDWIEEVDEENAAAFSRSIEYVKNSTNHEEQVLFEGLPGEGMQRSYSMLDIRSSLPQRRHLPRGPVLYGLSLFVRVQCAPSPISPSSAD